MQRRASSTGFGAVLSWCEREKQLGKQKELLWRMAMSGSAGSAPTNVLAARLANEGHVGEAIATLQMMWTKGFTDEVSARILVACGMPCDAVKRGPQRPPRAPAAVESKAAALLPYVLRVASPGDPASVCAAIERFAEEVLRPTRQWLKIAGGSKAEILTSALQSAPAEGVVLEIGTYFGFSAIRLAMAQPQRSIVSIEVDPEHALVAQCLIMYAGLSHRIDVRMGHSRDVLPGLLEQQGRTAELSQFAVAAVFMDQCGSRFWEDLITLARGGILLQGAVVVADNVLKPGAPVFLWHLFFGDLFRDAHVVSMEEFAMPGVEDWMAVATFAAPPSESSGLVEAFSGKSDSIRRELEDLEWLASRIRERAAGPGGVPFDEWAIFAEGMRARLLKLGIGPTAVNDSSE